MIEYSIYMMGNPIKPEEPQKAYAKNQVREIWDLNKFCSTLHHITLATAEVW